MHLFQFVITLICYIFFLFSVCMPVGLIKAFPKNNLQLMIESGAKGSSVRNDLVLIDSYLLV